MDNEESLPDHTSISSRPDDHSSRYTPHIQFPSHWNVIEQYGPHHKLDSTHLMFHDPETGQNIKWNSRSHRKGRLPVVTKIEENEEKDVVMIYGKVYWAVEWKNISWWVAQFFVWGSVSWVINGFLSFVPLVGNQEMNAYGVGLTALLGGTLFEIGAYLMVIEALNSSENLEFDKGRSEDSDIKPQHQAESKKKKFIWWGFRLHSIGFLASLLQLCAATIFWISTFTGVPGVIPKDNVGIVQGLYWTPQIVGGSGFIIASWIFMLETQKSWYRLEPTSLGWHVGFWNLVGAIGFTLCGIFGLYAFANLYQAWGMAFSTFWGGWSFLLGSYIQLFETLNKQSSGK